MKKFILLLSLLAIISCTNSSPDDSNVKDVARAVILHNLKSANSTEFHHNETINHLNDNTFEYKETINATNSFGGSLVENATVKIKWTGGDPSKTENWSVVDVNFSER
ncbi:hypothetical protein [Flavobacterium sp. N1994]|uniref:hypothetical protein n=1 Tax=Flavobacterium sp. N1994 TaxID=2986827 RepID=UPI002221D44E|nr:hypothetical protein [Flavobacterium sp. N1994]